MESGSRQVSPIVVEDFSMRLSHIDRMNALSDALPKIDFNYYRKLVSDPTLVDKLQKEVRFFSSQS